MGMYRNPEVQNTANHKNATGYGQDCCSLDTLTIFLHRRKYAIIAICSLVWEEVF